MNRPLLRAALWSAAFAALAAAGRAADEAVSLVLTYRAVPAQRAAFRAWVETKGAAQFAGWKKAGVFRDAHLLFSALPSTANPDLVVVLDFPRLAASARWLEIERRSPGGLSPEALPLAAVESGNFGAPLALGATAGEGGADAIFLVIFYEVIASSTEYRKYVQGYTAPQMRAWLKTGALASYAMYYNPTSYNTPWDAMLVLEYTDLAALARRDEIKFAARAQLSASDPAFKAFADSKATVRKDRATFYAIAIPLPP